MSVLPPFFCTEVLLVPIFWSAFVFATWLISTKFCPTQSVSRVSLASLCYWAAGAHLPSLFVSPPLTLLCPPTPTIRTNAAHMLIRNVRHAPNPCLLSQTQTLRPTKCTMFRRKPSITPTTPTAVGQTSYMSFFYSTAFLRHGKFMPVY